MKKHLLSAPSIFAFFILFFITCSSKPQKSPSTLSISGTNAYEEILLKYGISSKMENYGIPGMSIAIIKNGKQAWSRGYGVLQKGKGDSVNNKTLFSVGSVSKVGTAVMILKLKENGAISLDENVNQYLRAWKIPDNRYTQQQAVTLRHIMSHTGGLTVHGFADFNPGEILPSTVQILKGEWPAKNNPVFVDIPVGSQYRYSGGGTQVAQLVIEESSELPFHKAADQLLFKPLGMSRSSYENPVPHKITNIAKAHNRRGKPVALPRGYQSMPEAAASGLWTTPSDFAKLMIMLMKAYEGDSNYLSQNTVKDMMSSVPPSQYGLGPHIKEESDDILFSHGGSNESYKAHFTGSLNKKSGIIIFTNGARGFDLIEEVLPLFEHLLFKES